MPEKPDANGFAEKTGKSMAVFGINGYFCPVKGSVEQLISRQVASSRLFFMEEGNEELRVVIGGFERCGKNYQVVRSQYPWHVLELVHDGKGCLQMGNKNHIIDSGSCYLYGPDMAHEIRSSDEVPLGKYFVCLAGPGVPRAMAEAGLFSGWFGRCGRGDGVRRIFDLLIERGIHKTPQSSVLCSLMARQLLLMCGEDSACPADRNSAAFRTYQRVRGFIEREYGNASSLEKIARSCGVGAAYLCRLFAKYHDETPYQYLIRLRMEHAARLLLTPGANVKTVSAALGYSDAFHFSRVFKSVHQVPPSRFRFSGLHLRGE